MPRIKKQWPLIAILSVVFPLTAFAGTYFDASVDGTVLTIDTHEPYRTSCDNFADYLPFIYETDGTLLEGDASCSYTGGFLDPLFDGGLDRYWVVMWENNTPDNYSDCATGKDYYVAVLDCDGIMSVVQSQIVSGFWVNDVLASVLTSVDESTGEILPSAVTMIILLSALFFLYARVRGSLR